MQGQHAVIALRQRTIGPLGDDTHFEVRCGLQQNLPTPCGLPITIVGICQGRAHDYDLLGHTPLDPDTRLMLPDTAPNLSNVALALHARTAGAADLADLLRDSRARTVALAKAYASALGQQMTVPFAPELNPPLWELGHIGWFQEYWICRNSQRALGTRADPVCVRSSSILDAADTLYDSSHVPHATRWSLPLPNLNATLDYLTTGLNATLDCLERSAEDDASLYSFRLALFHEDMHAEAAVYMAQSLGLDVGLAAQLTVGGPPATCNVEAGFWQLGAGADTTPGFAFDNELAGHVVAVPAFEIDDRVVSWRRYLEFIPTAQDGSSPSTAWPRYLRQRQTSQTSPVWEQSRFGRWTELDLDAPACHLSYFEVQAWCHRAGRALPTEVQWEKAAMTHTGFQWGQVWEWTASTFAAYPGFEAHPYRDYSAPWFGTRPVLRGACNATAQRMAHPRYRNFFTPDRTDIFAGFRTCSQV